MSTFTSENAERAAALHPMAEKVANASARLKPLEQCTPEEARAQREEKGNPFAPPACDLAEIKDLQISSSSGSLMGRMYSPHFEHPGPKPALVFFHGGGHVVGNVEQYDTFAQQLAFQGNCIVISVEYRLAPETKSRGIYQDGFDSFQWVVANAESLGIDASKIAIGGDSAGGNLSIAVCLMCKQAEAIMPAYGLLIYPATDYRLHYPSIEEFAQGYFLTKAGKQWFREQFLEDESRAEDPIASSMLAELSGLPESFVITAGFDPLRDEGKAFADRMVEHGVNCRHLCYTDMIHGFVSFAGGIPAGMEALEEMGRELKRALSDN